MRGTAVLFSNSTSLRTALITVPFLLALVPVCAQTPEPIPAATPAVIQSTTPENPNSSGDIQTRIQRARALAAAHQLQPAVSELEAVRRATADDVVRNVTSVMLMGIYLEEGNYVRAQALLDEDFRARASGRDAALRTYFAIAGQTINGARSHLARYRSFGINVSDSDLPPEAIADLDRLRGLLERLAAQAKDIVAERKAYDALALLEDVISVRLSIARDSDDRATWESEYANTRQGLALSQSQIASIGVPALAGNQSVTSSTATKEPPAATKEPTSTPAQNVDTASSSPVPSAGSSEAKTDVSLSTGSLNSRASKRVVPMYPPLAKTSGVSGTVRVNVVVDETGKVAEITSSEGPTLLRSAAEAAARNWRFLPTAVNGKPVRLSGYIEFTFTR